MRFYCNKSYQYSFVKLTNCVNCYYNLIPSKLADFRPALGNKSYSYQKNEPKSFVFFFSFTLGLKNTSTSERKSFQTKVVEQEISHRSVSTRKRSTEKKYNILESTAPISTFLFKIDRVRRNNNNNCDIFKQ